MQTMRSCVAGPAQRTAQPMRAVALALPARRVKVGVAKLRPDAISAQIGLI